MKKDFEDLVTRVNELRERMRPLLPQLAAARNRYTANPSATNWELLEKVHAETSALHDESKRLIEQLPAASGLPPEMFGSSLFQVGELARTSPAMR